MKTVTYIFAFLIIIISSGFAQHHGGMMHNSKEKDPATAALLSIQPLPVAIGNFYTGNWERGIVYTTAELALFIPAAVLLSRNNWGMGMHNYSYYNNYYEDRRWTRSERNQFYYLLGGYILVKIISAFDAGYSAEIYNENISVNYDLPTNSATLTLNIPVR